MRELLSTARDLAGADTSFTWVDRAFADAHGLLDDASDPLPLWTPQIPSAHLFDTSKADAAGLTTRSVADTVAGHFFRTGVMRPELHAFEDV